MIIPKEQIKAENLIVDEYGLVYSSDGKTLMGSTEELTAGKYVIKDGTKVIGKNALYLYDEFQIENEDDEIELEIADSVEVIEDRSFDNLTLIKVKLPKNLKEIGLGAFVPPINNLPTTSSLLKFTINL